MTDRSLTQERLKELIHYNAHSGDFVWMKTNSNRAVAGENAGTITPYNYIVITIDSVKYFAHRLAFLYTTGRWPSDQIDHINGTRTDNRWSNLREATSRENNKNSGMKKNNKSGISGVYWNKEKNKWCGQVRGGSCGKKIFLGYFGDIADACVAVKQARVVHGYHENHGRKP
jgi:hypothetical protein